MKILFLSDTHGHHRGLTHLPEADLLIHGGDIVGNHGIDDLADFVDWLESLPYKHKIFVAGNHDECLDNADIDPECLPEGCHRLRDNGCEVDGVKIWGMPYSLSADLAGLTAQRIGLIPKDTDVLVSHYPPLGILDRANIGENMGDSDLLKRVKEVKPRFHLFGHIHEEYGIQKIDGITFVNGSVVNNKYELENQPILLEI